MDKVNELRERVGKSLQRAKMQGRGSVTLTVNVVIEMLEMWEQQREDCDIAIRRAIDTREKLVQARAAKWIPCSERLPESDEAVWAWVCEIDDFDYGGGQQCTHENGIWFDEFHRVINAFDGYHVTHWMELPEGPGEE